MAQAKTWTAKRIVAAMRRWRREHGRAPREREWNRAQTRPEWAPWAREVQGVMGSWSAALAAAGMDAQRAYSQIPRKRVGSWTRELVVDAVHRWAAEHDGEPPAAGDWDPGQARRRGRHDRVQSFYAGLWPHASVATRACAPPERPGRWNDVLEAAGFPARASGGPRP